MRRAVAWVAAGAAVALAEEASMSLFTVKAPYAKCLDGSQPGYYFRPGSGTGASKWVIHYEGGGWCMSLEDCYQRSTQELGSSSALPPTMLKNDDQWGTDPSRNPLLYNWNQVYVKYCDGGYFSGDLSTPLAANGKLLWFNGKANQRGLVADLIANRGLRNATDVVISGCSAGGVQVFINLDYLRSLIEQGAGRKDIKIVGMPNSGYLYDYKGEGQCAYEFNMMWPYMMMNVSSAVPKGCLDSFKGTDQAWKCMFFAQYLVPHLKTPVFVLQSRFDEWQTKYIYCGKETDYAGANRFGRLFETAFKNTMGKPNTSHGYLLDSCSHHCGGWNNVQSDEGLTYAQAFAKWYASVPAPGAAAAAGSTPLRQMNTGDFKCEACCNNGKGLATATPPIAPGQRRALRA